MGLRIANSKLGVAALLFDELDEVQRLD